LRLKENNVTNSKSKWTVCGRRWEEKIGNFRLQAGFSPAAERGHSPEAKRNGNERDFQSSSLSQTKTKSDGALHPWNL
jgi:hypothetical protein